ncbi:MAG TPA: ABC transporter substrate-binding protein, partial [Tepidiformaceae bacterium]
MKDRTNYWLRRQVSRRTALKGTAVAGAGAATLAIIGCGDDDDDDGGDGGGGGLLPTAQATPTVGDQPVPGGSFSFQISSPPPSLDPYTQTSFVNAYMNGLSYSKLARFAAGVPAVAPTDFTMEPDLAQTLPEQPDASGLQYTFKLKPAKFHNGRELTSEDVSYAFDRYMNFERSVHKSTLNWVDKIETPSADTVLIKTKAPFADAIQFLGGNLGAWISPKEHAESEEAATKMLGSGPFIHTDYQTGVSLSFRKNPDYYDKPYPYFDEVKVFITTDTQKRVADFSAGSVDLTWLFLPSERDQLKRQRPDAQFEETQGIGGYIYLRT